MSMMAKKSRLFTQFSVSLALAASSVNASPNVNAAWMLFSLYGMSYMAIPESLYAYSSGSIQ